ncbi:MAG: RNA methyltransferase [Spirochaetia bacterium]|nr:RNA methyltransferase [Spirochaetia bacterium]
MDSSGLSKYAVLLCRVEGSINVGAACRAMKVMGISRLVLAACPEYIDVDVRMHALHAYDVYEQAERYSSLDLALADFSLAAGFTRRTGQKRKENVSVESFAATLPNRVGNVALVFGNERNGLSDEELSLCDEAVSIASSRLFPSLNLSHAVQIACWELSKNLAAASTVSRESASRRLVASRAQVEGAAHDMADAMQKAGLYKLAGRPETEVFIRSVAMRAGLSRSELKRMTSLFVKLGALSGRT